MELYLPHQDYNKNTERRPSEWSYWKKGLSTDHERLIERIHTDFVEGTGKMNEKLLDKKQLVEGFSANHFRDSNHMQKFYLYSLFAIVVSILCFLFSSKEGEMNVMNFVKSPNCIGAVVVIIALYYLSV